MNRHAFADAVKAILFEAESFFLYDFTACRNAFLEASESFSGSKEHQFYPLLKDPNTDSNGSGEIGLGTDTLFLGDRHAENIIVLTSGTHGVEGYCGSAIQQSVLKYLKLADLPPNTALLLVHSLNPWGMHWARRCDADGIDLNRNFIDYQQAPELDPNYNDILATLVNSSSRYQEMQKQSQIWGQERFDTIFSGGQYTHKWAPFFGGQHPAHGRQVIEGIIQHYDLANRNTMVIDLHTGLGPWSFGELICDHFPESHGQLQAKSVFGPAIANAHDGDSFSVPKLGLLDYCFHQFMDEQGFFLTLEFGTYGSAALFEVLLSDHVYWRDHSPASIDDANYQFYRKRMIEHFCPKDVTWQQAVLFKSWQVIERLLLSLRKS